MTKLWRIPLVLFAFLRVCHGQTFIPDHLPELKYPPIARIARIQGEVIVSFRLTAEGKTVDVKSVSGPPMLAIAAVDNVKAWHFASLVGPVGKVHTVTFFFSLKPPQEGYDTPPITKVERDVPRGVRVISILSTGLQRSACPSGDELIVPPAVLAGDFVELERWNETVKVDANGLISWKYQKVHRSAHISSARAKSLLEQFRTQAVWTLCGSYYQAGLMDGSGSSFKVRIGGAEKGVSEYGDSAPSIFREVELAVDAAANTHQWRHGDPKKESIIEIAYEYLPKPGKTKLMDAAQIGDKKEFQAALADGDKFTDVDASGWTPLMYAAGSYGDSMESELLKAGVDVNARSKRGETALMASAATGMADEDLLDAGTDVNAVNDVGMTALMLLVQRGDPDEIQILLKAGADARMRDTSGRTALDYLNAANCGDPIVQATDPQWMTVGYSRCNVLDSDEYKKSKQLLIDAGAKPTRTYAPK